MPRIHATAKLLILAALLVCAAAPINCAKTPEEKTKDKGKPTAVETDKRAAAKSDTDPSDGDTFGLGLPAPEISVKDTDGKSVRLSSFKGGAVVLAFWDVSCEVCKKQLKELEDGLAKKKARATMLTITRDITPSKNRDAAEVLKKAGVEAPVLFDTDNKTGQAYRLSGVPFFALIDGDGLLQGAGPFAVSQKMKTMTFIDIVASVANDKKVSYCEFADTNTPDVYKKFVGKDAPGFRLLDLNGNEESPIFYKGFSNLLLVFWSPTCPHCRAELPRIEAFSRKKAKKLDLKIMSVVGLPDKGDQTFEQLVAMTRQVALMDKLSFPVVLDVGQKVRAAYEVEGVPSLFYVDENGKIQHAWRGESILVGENIECAVSDKGK